MTNVVFRAIVQFVPGALLFFCALPGSLWADETSHNIEVTAVIPESIELKGLPESVRMTLKNGVLSSGPVYFQVNHNRAVGGHSVRYWITLKSSMGGQGENFYLQHKTRPDERLPLYARFRDALGGGHKDFLHNEKLWGVTDTAPDQLSDISGKSASIVFYNDDASALAMKKSGQYSSLFTITVGAY